MRESVPLYPVNLKIAGRLCLVVGGGAVAERKIESLLFCRALVRVVSPEAGETVRRLADSGAIEWRQQPYRPGDLEGAFLVIAATNRPEVQQQIANDAADLRILLNSVDAPAACDFQLPSLLRRGDLLITVSTGGCSPAFSRSIREELEDEFGWEYGAVIALLGRLRQLMVGEGRGADGNAAVFRDILALDLVGFVRRMDWEGLRSALRGILPPHFDMEPMLLEFVETIEQRKDGHSP